MRCSLDGIAKHVTKIDDRNPGLADRRRNRRHSKGGSRKQTAREAKCRCGRSTQASPRKPGLARKTSAGRRRLLFRDHFYNLEGPSVGNWKRCPSKSTP